MTAQEDNAILASLLRSAISKTTDFSRVILMRSAANFDRQGGNMSCLDNLFYVPQGAFESAVGNLWGAGREVVRGIVGGWRRGEGFERGVREREGGYVGDLFGSLGGKPDFGPGEVVGLNPVQQRGMDGRRGLVGNPRGRGKRGWVVARAADGGGNA